MKIFIWHVHGSYMTSLVQGRHTYLLPLLPDRGPDGRGRAQTWHWPRSVVEVTPKEAATAEVDLVILQRPQELFELAQRWLGGRRPGRDLPAIYLELNAPTGQMPELRHPAADRSELTLVHVTHFNELFWDAGATPTRVIELGIIDPGDRYTGELARAVAVVNEPVRRARAMGIDLLGRISAGVPYDLIGVGASALGGIEGLSQYRLHDEMAHRRVYVHPMRWTSLGLSLIEAMHLGMPVVALASTEVGEAVPPGAGVTSVRIEVLNQVLRQLISEPEQARIMGKAARKAAMARYGLGRFLIEWDDVIQEACR